MQISNRAANAIGWGKWMVAACMLALLYSPPARADGMEVANTPNNPLGGGAKPSDSFEIGIEGENYQYREPLFAKLQGYGFGVDATYTYNWRGFFLKANAMFDYFDLDYSSDGTGSDSGISDYKGDFRGLFGYDFKFNKRTTLAPYIGLGYRLLFDAEGEKITNVGASGYDRRSQYLYAPVGVGFGFHTGKWGFSTFAEYDYLIQGWQTSYLSDIGYDNNLQNNQSSGYGIRGNFMVYPPIDFYDFSVGPYVRYWNIKDSNVQPLYSGGVLAGYGQEPGNNTLEMGIAANITFQ